MAERTLTVLGTASQVPTPVRNHIGFFLRWEKEGILIDPGEGTQRQLLMAGIAAPRITRILISHFHGDHCLGLPGVVQRLSLSGAEQEVDILYPASGQKYLNNLLDSAVFYRNVKLKLHPIASPGTVLETGNFTVSARHLEHRADTWGYRIKEPDTRTLLPDRLPSGIQGHAIGKLKDNGSIEYQGRTITLEEVSEPRIGQCFAYILDTRVCENAGLLASNADMLVSEATYLASESTQAEQYFHLTAGQAAEIAKEAGVKKLVLAHYSQRYKNLGPFVREAGAIHPDVVAARDLQVIPLPKRKRLL
ncbi:MAG: ribonuclease Z [Thermodesulfobacteriota bacterium]